MRGGQRRDTRGGDDGQKLTFSLVPLHTRSICTPDLRSPPKGVPHPLPRRSRRRLTRVCVLYSTYSVGYYILHLIYYICMYIPLIYTLSTTPLSPPIIPLFPPAHVSARLRVRMCVQRSV